MKEKNIQHILYTYFGKHFSGAGKSLFGRWLRAGDDAGRKEELLLDLWQQSPAEITDDTYSDWNKMQRRLYTIPSVGKPLPLYRRLMKYSAVVALMLLAASATYLITRQASSSKHIEMAEFFVPYGESRMVTLPDSSKVWVDAGSMLVYPKNFSDVSTRSVYLTGKASFTVKKDPQKPFIVKTTYLDVEALGTVFTVKSYPSDVCTETTLEEGSVRVDIKENSIQPSVLKPNQQLLYSHQDGTLQILTVDAGLYGMERDGYLIFDNVSFAQLVEALERKFNVVMQYNAQKYGNQFYNVKFAPDETLEDALGVLQELTGLSYKIKKNVVIIN